MNDFESLKVEYKKSFPDWSDKEIVDLARKMTEKYSTIKRGPNVIHLDYFGELLTDADIAEIDSNISKVGLELSRFDKNGVPYASIEDFYLHIAIFLNDPVVSNIILGISAGAMWDSIKISSLFIWKRLKERHLSQQKEKKSKKLNFGLHLKLNDTTALDLKIDGELSEKTVLAALDKVVDLVRATKINENHQPAKFFIINDQSDWSEIDVNEELRKEVLKQKKQ